MKAKIILLLFVCALTAQAATEQRNDSLSVDNPKKNSYFQPQQLILPGALITVGAFGINHRGMQSVNEEIRNGFECLRGDCRFHADDYLQYVPVASHVLLGLTGVKSKHPFRERLAVAATAYIALGVLVNGTKWIVDVKRPDSEALNSFPSGHTATTFMGAELVRMEYGLGYGLGAYGIALGVGFLRMYNDRHWFTDVLAGAGIGILSARIGYWMLPYERKLFGWDKKKNGTFAVLPSYDVNSKSWGVAFSCNF